MIATMVAGINKLNTPCAYPKYENASAGSRNAIASMDAQLIPTILPALGGGLDIFFSPLEMVTFRIPSIYVNAGKLKNISYKTVTFVF
jgi:hypothetical protein